MTNHEKAERDYMLGMKYREIAEKYHTTINTVKSWKKRYGWDRKKGAPKKGDVCTHISEIENMGTKETLQNNELTPEQQMFCLYYVRTFNATQSYQKAYGCSHESAMRSGSRLLKNVAVRKEIELLKEYKRQQILISEHDIVELQMRIAGADMGDYVSFGQANKKNCVKLHESQNVDMQLVQKVRQGRDGITIELANKQEAIKWLTKYFLMHPDDKYKAEYDRMRAGMKDNTAEEIIKNMQTITELIMNPAENRNIEDFEEEAEREDNEPSCATE